MLPAVKSQTMKASTLWATALALTFALGGCSVTTYSNGNRPPPSNYNGGGYNDNTNNQAGWQKLGERTVTGGGVDHDVIYVGRSDGQYSAVMIKAERSAFELYELVVTFGDGTTYRPQIRQTFGRGQTSHAIDLPGGRRAIQRVDFRYKDLPGGGRAQLELWGRY